MKIAAVTNDGKSISAHFGRARNYLVMTIENGQIAAQEMRDKSACHHGHDHGHGHDAHDHDDHADHAHEHGHHGHGHRHHAHEHSTLTMMEQVPPAEQRGDSHTHAATLIADCDVVLSRGMGRGMYRNLQQVGVRVVLTNIVGIAEAVQAFLAGTLEEHPELVH
jgi:predicted Fe-Mo cluster-binding NifX family protein